MRAAFWRFAHQHYHATRLTFVVELAAFTWMMFFTVTYAAAFIAGWWPDLPAGLVETVLIATPIAFGLFHRRIRLEAARRQMPSIGSG